MISILTQKRHVSAIMRELDSFRKRVDDISSSTSVARQKLSDIKKSGDYSTTFIERQEQHLRKIAADARRDADKEREKARSVVDFRLAKLRDTIITNFTELPRPEITEFIKLYTDMGEPLTNEELKMLEGSAVNYQELRLLDTVSRRMARPRNLENGGQRTGLEPTAPTYQIIMPDVREELKRYDEFAATVHAFISDCQGETFALLPENATPVMSASAAAALDAFEGSDSPEKRLLKRLEDDFKRTEPGRKYSSSTLTAEEIRIIDALLSDSIDKPKKAVQLAKADEDLRNILVKDCRYSKAILQAEEQEDADLNRQLGASR